jgi:hypothetical protein
LVPPNIYLRVHFHNGREGDRGFGYLAIEVGPPDKRLYDPID